MEESNSCYLLKHLFNLVGLLLFLLDIALDIRTVVSFYQDGDYVYMAVMIFLLLGSSVLLQVFSWLWYSDSLDELKTKVETFADRHKLIKPLHFLQLGLYLSMRSFLQEKRKMSWISTIVYFLWNLLLIIPRVTALALFCSVLPRYIIAHFLSLWMLLVLVVWSQKTDHMKSPGWEWLFRATVGLIWYFSWFNVSTGNMKLKNILYYGVMGLDTVMLLGFWCWKEFEYTGCWSSLNPYIVIPTLVGLHIVGILLKMIYYRWFHPNCDEQKIAKPSEHQNISQAAVIYNIETDTLESSPEAVAVTPAQPVTGVLKRGRNMAANFYY
ncbi:unnamed protein product [Leuciscus chuanchicus]